MNVDLNHIEKTPFFFILGRPRSGTTLLSLMLDAHPNIILPFESAIIINLFPKYGKIIHWDKQLLERFYNDLVKNRKFNDWPIDLDELRESLCHCTGNCSFGTIIKLIYLHFQSYYGNKDIRLIGDKNPVYSLYGNKLLEIFPHAKIIHLARDYRDQILSVKKVDFEAPVTALLAYRWKYAQKKLLALKSLGDSRYYYLQYEQLVNNPEVKMREVFQFLGVDYHEEVLHFYEKKHKALEQFSEEDINRFHSSLFQPISKDKTGIWKNQMKARDIFTADALVGKTADRSGYTREFKQNRWIMFVRNLLWIIYGKFSIQQRFLVDRLPYAFKMRLRSKGPLLAKLYHALFNSKTHGSK